MRWTGDDMDALSLLDTNFKVSRGGMIYPKDLNITETPEETSAIDYLCAEWDYGYTETNPDIKGT